ncbi:RNB domain-containing ribonuclease [bacterium]|jgi:hypothetical protein|nr:RNB domain-containing ribonuclease [bacterium]MBT6293437.1 RNB domain-containing ribonuclease [bacterium]
MAILLPKKPDYDINRTFPEDVLKESYEIILDEAFNQTRMQVSGVTIDGETSKDLDDAIDFTKFKSGYKLDISIADPSSIIHMSSQIDNEALKRVFTLYRNTYNNPMIPSLLSEDLITLKEKSKRPCITVRSFFDSEFTIVNYEIFQSCIDLKKRLTYSTCTQVLNKDIDLKILNKEYGFKVDKFLINIGNLAASLKSQRIGKKYSIQSLSSEEIVSELMVLTNHLVSNYMISNKIPGLFRSHGFKSSCPNERAEYSNYNFGHLGLSLDSYTHFTSPLRRYPDLAIGRILHSHFDEKSFPYLESELKEMCEYFNQAEIDTIDESLGDDFELDVDSNITDISDKDFLEDSLYIFNLSIIHENKILDLLDRNLINAKIITNILLDERKLTKGWLRVKSAIKEKIDSLPNLALNILLEACNNHLLKIAKIDFEIFPIDSYTHSRILLTIDGKYYSNTNGVVANSSKRAKALSAKLCLFGLIEKKLIETEFNYHYK